MRTLNDIPDHLRDPEPEPWTPARGLPRGSIFTLTAACAIGLGMGGVGYLAPVLVQHIVLNFAWGFFIALALFGVMHGSARMVSPCCTMVVVVCAALSLAGGQYGAAMHAADVTVQGTASSTPPATAATALFCSVPALVGTAAAAFLCRDGDFSLGDLADFLMINPFTGRRI